MPYTESMAILTQCLDSPMDPMDCVIAATSVPFFSGSMMIIHCVAGPVWTLLSLDAAVPYTFAAVPYTESIAILTQFLDSPMDPMD